MRNNIDDQREASQLWNYRLLGFFSELWPYASNCSRHIFSSVEHFSLMVLYSNLLHLITCLSSRVREKCWMVWRKTFLCCFRRDDTVTTCRVSMCACPVIPNHSNTGKWPEWGSCSEIYFLLSVQLHYCFKMYSSEAIWFSLTWVMESLCKKALNLNTWFPSFLLPTFLPSSLSLQQGSTPHSLSLSFGLYISSFSLPFLHSPNIFYFMLFYFFACQGFFGWS